MDRTLIRQNTFSKLLDKTFERSPKKYITVFWRSAILSKKIVNTVCVGVKTRLNLD